MAKLCKEQSFKKISVDVAAPQSRETIPLTKNEASSRFVSVERYIKHNDCLCCIFYGK
jgi:hypothetical protein